jgi:hypothetical protein
MGLGAEAAGFVVAAAGFRVAGFVVAGLVVAGFEVPGRGGAGFWVEVAGFEVEAAP